MNCLYVLVIVSYIKVIGLLRNLTFLELSKNKLECLPPEMEALDNLTDLHLSVNELLELPENIGIFIISHSIVT